MSTALWIAATCLGFLALVYLWQDRLLYFPQRATVEEVVSAGLTPWPSAEDFRGLVAEPRGAVRGTAIVFHGNAGHVGHRAFYAQALVPLGFRVILAEYPGYGPRAGKPGEANFIRDASELVALAHGQYGGPLLLVGESLGGRSGRRCRDTAARAHGGAGADHAVGPTGPRGFAPLSVVASEMAAA